MGCTFRRRAVPVIGGRYVSSMGGLSLLSEVCVSGVGSSVVLDPHWVGCISLVLGAIGCRWALVIVGVFHLGGIRYFRG